MKKTLKGTKARLWKLVSKYIRLRDADWRGDCQCISCGKIYQWDEMDAGHWIPKSRGNSMYFEEDNIHAQCRVCNRFGSHDTGYKFGKNLEKKIGKERMEELDKLQHTTVKYTIRDYEAMIEEYKTRIKLLG